MNLSIFNYKNYKEYLKDWIHARPARGHGEKTRIAEVVRCNPGYISQVLEGEPHLSLEQTALLSSYLNHNGDESRYLLFLVQHARAGNAELREQLEILLQEIREKRKLLRNRPEFKNVLAPEQQAIYYSAWYYTAIHALLSIPEFQSSSAIAQRLHLPLTRTRDALEFLVSIGIAEELGGGNYKLLASGFHLGDNSHFIAKHHTHWRLKAIDALDRPDPTDLHFSSVGSIGEKDLPKVRAIMIKAIEEIRAVVRASGEDTLFCYNMDLFKPG